MKHSKILKNEFAVLVKETLPKDVSLSDVEVWFQDEIRIGQQGSLSRLWAPKGTRPRVVRQKQFLSQYLYGAICPKKKKGAAIIAPAADGQTLQIHLEEISHNIEKRKHGVVILDQAGFHLNQGIVVPKNISILFLPPASPELNPQEMVWQSLRDRFFHNRAYKDIEEIIDTASLAWNTWIKNPEEIFSLGYRKWADI